MDKIYSIIDECEAKNPGDIDQACKDALKKIWKLAGNADPDFKEFVRPLVEAQVRNMVHESRGHFNKRLKNGVSSPDDRPKVSVAGNARLQRMDRSWLNWRIGGRTLGSFTRGELFMEAENQKAHAIGYEINSRLLREVGRKVPEGKVVKDVLTDRQIANLHKRIEKEVYSKGISLAGG